jgi:hypothetical protein
MSTMAGFDLVIEVAKETALRLIQANVRLGGTRINPPFQVLIPIAFGTDSYASVIVTGMSLDLVGAQGANTTVHFANSSIIVKTPALTITQLDGNVTIATTLELVDFGGPDQKALATNLAVASANVVFSPMALSRVAVAVAGLPIDVAGVTNFAQNALEDFIRSAGWQVIPEPTFKVIPGISGSISEGKFDRLTVHNIAGQAVGVFGMLLPDRPMGDPNQKTATLISPGIDICVDVGPEAFHQLIFCTNLALGSPASSLPPSCGSGSLDQDGMTITDISDSFGNGQIDVNGTFKKSGFCYDAYGSFHAAVTLTVSITGLYIIGNVALDEPSVDVHVPWYCTLAEVFLGPIGLVLANSIRSSALKSGKDLQDSFNSMVGGGALTFGAGGLSNASFKQATITPEAIAVGAAVDADLPVAAKPGVEIRGSVTTSINRLSKREGLYVVPDGCMEGSYPWIEFAENQTGTYVVLVTLLGQPLTLEWRLECWQGYWGYNSSPKLVSAATLTGDSGTVVLDGLTTRFALPLPGGSAIVQPVHVEYAATTNTITLHNRPSEGNYGFILTLTATDPAGNVATAQTGVGFDGDSLTILGGYQEKLAQCAAMYRDRVARFKTDPGMIPPWVPVNYPDPEQLVQFVRALAAEGTEEAEQLLLHTVLAHGSSYFRALNSRQAVDAPGLTVQPGRIRQD